MSGTLWFVWWSCLLEAHTAAAAAHRGDGLFWECMAALSAPQQSVVAPHVANSRMAAVVVVPLLVPGSDLGPGAYSESKACMHDWLAD